MAVLYINTRCKQILNVLLNQTEYMTIERLANRLKISRRSAYYDLCKINVWLEQMNAQPLEVERGHGLLIPLEDRAKIEAFLSAPDKKDIYIFSPEERIKLMIAYILEGKEAVFLKQLTACCEVSRSTVFNDLKELEERLKQYDLQLNYQAKTGYTISGDTVRKRALFLLYFRALLHLYQNGLLKIFDKAGIEIYYEQLRCVEQELGYQYVGGALHSIAALMPAMHRHTEAFAFPGLNIERIRKTSAYQAAKAHFPMLCEDEIIYLTLHLLGSRTRTMPQDILADEAGQSLSNMTTGLISEFERVACVKFDARDALEQALRAHLKTSIYRFRYGIQIGNLLCEDIKKEYPELFTITRIAAKRLESVIELPIPDEEVAFLALHFGAFLKVGEKEPDCLRILIVCVNGISTGNMIKREVQKLLPYAEIVDVVAAVDLQNAQDICNLIISTVKINTVVPVITIHPVMTVFDRNTILNHRAVASKNLTVKRDKLFEVVKKYVAPKDYKNLLADLTACLQGGDSLELEDFKNDSGLMNVLDSNRIRLFECAHSWQESICQTGKCLTELNSIEQRYLETIISQIHDYGPYMFLTEDVILAHAKPEDGVNCLDLSLAIYRKPVKFSDSRCAKLVFVLAAEDQERHLKILQDIIVLISDAEKINTLVASQSVDEALERMRLMLQETTA